MRGFAGYFVCIMAGLTLLLTPVQAEDEKEKKEKDKPESMRWVWYPTAKCNTKPEEGAPGASPDTAIPLKHFSNLKSFALREANIAAGVVVGEDEFKPDCKWVRLTGFFRWFDYYHYRGQLYEDAKSYYFGSSVSYIIEDFGNESTRRGDLQARRVTLVGRFYNLCSAAERDEKESGENWWIIGGPCHYGRDKGMMLTDVIIEKVHDDAPRFLAGDYNRQIIQELVPYDGEDLSTLRNRIREWAALVQSGPAAYADKEITHPVYKLNPDPNSVQEIRERILNPDSYVSYLSKLRAFKQLDPTKAQLAVFRDQYFVEDWRDDRAVGCICLQDDCTDRWPLLHNDADNFLGSAACIEFDRHKDGVWRW